MIKKWEFYSSDEKLVDDICNRYNLNKVIGKIIVNRNVIKDEDVRIFINPTRDDFYDPFLFKEMDIAVERIIKAINNKEKMLCPECYSTDDSVKDKIEEIKDIQLMLFRSIYSDLQVSFYDSSSAFP